MSKQPEFIETPTIETLMPAAKRMTQFIHNNRIDVVVVGGASAQTVATMVKEWWKMLYPQKPTPAFLAIGKTRRDKPGRRYVVRTGALSDDELKSILQRFGRLSPETNVFIMDELVDTGKTLSRIARALKQCGVRRIKTGALTQLKRTKPPMVGVDFVGALVDVSPRFCKVRTIAVETALHLRQMGQNPKGQLNILEELKRRIRIKLR